MKYTKNEYKTELTFDTATLQRTRRATGEQNILMISVHFIYNIKTIQSNKRTQMMLHTTPPFLHTHTHTTHTLCPSFYTSSHKTPETTSIQTLSMYSKSHSVCLVSGQMMSVIFIWKNVIYTAPKQTFFLKKNFKTVDLNNIIDYYY